MESNVEYPDTLIKVVKPIGDGAHVTLLKAWVGKTVKVTIVKPTEQAKENNKS
jgi:putative transposon-encoded protein